MSQSERLDYIKARIKELKIRFPNAELSEKLGENQGNVSSMLNGRRDISEKFWKRFIAEYGPPENQTPDDNYYLPPGEKKYTLTDFVGVLMGQNEFLQRIIEGEIRLSLNELKEGQMRVASALTGALDIQAEVAAMVLGKSSDQVKDKRNKATADQLKSLKGSGKVGNTRGKG